MTAYEWSREHNAFVKNCHKCNRTFIGHENEEKAFDIFLRNFYASSNQSDGLSSACTRCRLDANIERKFNGLTRSDTERILRNQGGGCAICRKEISLKYTNGLSWRTAKIDHNHRTGKLRGILCTGCNSDLGKLESLEWQKWARRARAYIESYE